MSFCVQYPPPPNSQGSSSYHPTFNGFVPRPPPPPSSAPTFYPPPPQVFHPHLSKPPPQPSPPPAPIPQPIASTSKSTLYPSRPHPTPSYNSPRLLSRSRPSNTSTAPGVTFISSIVLPDSVKHTFTLWQEEEQDEEEKVVPEKVVGLSNGAEKLSFGVAESSSGKGKGVEVEGEVSQPLSIEEKKESPVLVELRPSAPSPTPAPAPPAPSTSVPAPSPPPPPPSPPPPPPPVSLPPKPTPAPQPSPPIPSSVPATSPPPTIPASTPAPSSPSTPKSTVVVPSSSTTDAPSSPPPAPTVPAPAPPPVKKAPTSWASLLRPPPSANPPPSSQTTVNGSTAATKSKANGVGKKVKPSSLAQLLSVGAAPGEGGPASDTTARGLVNRGNLCFVNSILQVLVFTPGFYTLFKLLGEMLPADLKGEYPLVDAMIIFLREFPPSSSASSAASASQFPAPPTAAASSTASSTASSSASTPTGSNGASKTLGGGPADAFVPEGIYTALTHIPCFSFMRQGHQEDAEEFLGFFLNTLHEEIGSLLNREGGRIGGAVSAAVNGAGGGGWGEEGEEGVRVVAAGGGGSGNGGDDGWMEVGKKNKSSLLRTTESRPNSITHLFTGLLRSTLLLPSPAKPSITIEPFSPLQLDIQPPHIHTIEAALLHLTSPEVIHGVTLPGGRGEGEASKRCELERMPRVLMLHLKRFGWDMSGSGKARKMGKAVGFGEELIIPRDAIAATRRTPEPIRYKLFGVVYHHGPTVSSGHYTSAVLAQATKTWLHVDDETVTTVDAKEVCVTEQAAKEGNAGDIGGRERCAYLLFYERVE